MDLDHAREFIRNNHHAILATARADGRPQLSPIACGVDAEGRVIVSSRETAFKVKNLRRAPQASVCVFTDGFYGEWVQVDGHAAVVSMPEALDGLVDYYRRVAGELPDWEDYRNAMEREGRVLVRIELERVGPKRSG